MTVEEKAKGRSSSYHIMNREWYNRLSKSTNKEKKKMPPPWLPSANLTSTKLPFPLNSQLKCLARPRRTLTLRSGFVTNCASNSGLNVGSPIVIIEAPPALKTATPMPSLRANTGQVKAGDVGRSVSVSVSFDFFGSPILTQFHLMLICILCLQSCGEKAQGCMGSSSSNRNLPSRCQIFQTF